MSTPTVTIPGYVVGTWDIDAVHSDVSITVRHMAISKVRGAFKDFAGEIVTAANPLDSTVNATIQAASIDTQNPDRDGHIRNADFLDVETYPTVTFASTALTQRGDDFTLTGDLTLRGVTKSVDLALEVTGVGPDAYGGTRIGFSATTTVNRKDFGMTFNAALETGGLVVGEKLTVSLEIQGVLRKDA